MNGISGEKHEIINADTSAIEPVETVAESLGVVSVMIEPVEPSNEENTATADNENDDNNDNEQGITEVTADSLTEDTAQNNVRVFPRVICGILAAVGIVSYGYLGYLGIGYMKNGGIGRLTVRSVFGGCISSASPLKIGVEETVPDTDGEVESPAKGIKIQSEDIGCDDPDTVFNETKYKLEGNYVSASAVPKYSEDKTVLIIHTHGTEGYAEGGDVSADENFREEDPDKSVVKIGSAYAEILESKGIRTVHCTEMFDAESYVDAYKLSGEAVSAYMRDDPSISYVIDIHRDAVIRENGAVVRSDDGGAQLMIVCGTDEMGAEFPKWRENFTFGVEYQHKLYEKAPNLVRHMNLRRASFNQQLCERYLLLEVGTCGNTLDEAEKSARIAAEVFADMILSE